MGPVLDRQKSDIKPDCVNMEKGGEDYNHVSGKISNEKLGQCRPTWAGQAANPANVKQAVFLGDED